MERERTRMRSCSVMGVIWLFIKVGLLSVQLRFQLVLVSSRAHIFPPSLPFPSLLRCLLQTVTESPTSPKVNGSVGNVPSHLRTLSFVFHLSSHQFGFVRGRVRRVADRPLLSSPLVSPFFLPSPASSAPPKEERSSKPRPVNGLISSVRFGSRKSELGTRSTWNLSMGSRVCRRVDGSW